MNAELIETDSPEAFLDRATAALEEAITSALSKQGQCTLGLSGGKTPLPVYRKLRDRPIDWTNVWIFLVDERYVSPDHADSNLRSIREALLDPIAFPAERLVAPDTWKPLPECVHLFDQGLRTLLTKGAPDVVTLGFGEDGHLASLFPPLAPEALEGPYAIATHTERYQVADRISVTMPVLRSAARSLFLIAGRGKKRTWVKMGKSDNDPSLWPAQAILATGNATVIAEWGPEKK